MTLIDLGDYKIRFDPKEVRISIDGEIIDIGARSKEVESFDPNYYDLPPPSSASTGDPRLKQGKKLNQKSPE